MGGGKRATVLLKPDLIWAALERELGPPVAAERPPGSVTAQEVATKYGIDYSTASGRLNRQVAAGKLSRTAFRVRGSNRPTMAYSVVQS